MRLYIIIRALNPASGMKHLLIWTAAVIVWIGNFFAMVSPGPAQRKNKCKTQVSTPHGLFLKLHNLSNRQAVRQ
ncbi:MAG: hypothetical protein WCR06_04490, partial [bacterium]